jgi:hypothetical protein
LAAHSRGILVIAWEIWRNSLRTEPDLDLEEQLEEAEEQNLQHTMWVTPWDQMLRLFVITHYRLKAYPIDPRQQFHFITEPCRHMHKQTIMGYN